MHHYKKIVGERIYLSPKDASEESIQKFTEWMNDFETTDYIGNSPHLFTYAGEADYIQNSATNSTNNRSFDIVDLKNDKLIGAISLNKFNWIDRNAELGIFIGDKDYLSHGYGSEAIKLLLDYGFNYLNLHSINLSLLGSNERAHKCYLKCGFKDAGTFRNSIYLNGKYYDRLFMDILKDEFNEEYIKNKNVK